MQRRTVQTVQRATSRWFHLLLGVVVLVACASLLAYTNDRPRSGYESRKYTLPVISDAASLPAVWQDVPVACTGLEDVSVMLKYATLGGTINQYLSHISAFMFADAFNAQVIGDVCAVPRGLCHIHHHFRVNASRRPDVRRTSAKAAGQGGWGRALPHRKRCMICTHAGRELN